MMWRPDGLKKPGLLDEFFDRQSYDKGFDAGADAVLMALRKRGMPNHVQFGQELPEKGTWVFIPDDEETK